MAEIDRKAASTGGGGGGNVTVVNTPANPVVTRPLDCVTDAVDICDRAGRLVGIVFGNLTELQQRAITNELLVQLTNAGVEIDPRDIRLLTFLTDKVDVSGSTVTTASGSLSTMEDAFMAFRLLMSYIEDLSMTIDPSSGRVRQKLETIDSTVILPTVTTVTSVNTVASVTNIAQIGGVVANSFIFDEMDIVWNTGIRSQIA